MLGNFFWHFIFSDIIGDDLSPQEKFDKIYGEICEEYKSRQTPSQFTALDIGHFCDAESPAGAFPFLRGKAGQCRHLVPIMREVFLKYARRGVDYKEHMIRIIHNLNVFYECILSKDARGFYHFVYPAEIVTRIRDSIDKILLHYSFLTRVSAATRPPRFLWNFTPKFHHLYHIGEMSQWTSMRLAWTYNNEDFMSDVQHLGESHRHALVASRRSVGMAQSYLLGRALAMHFRSLGDIQEV